MGDKIQAAKFDAYTRKLSGVTNQEWIVASVSDIILDILLLPVKLLIVHAVRHSFLKEWDKQQNSIYRSWLEQNGVDPSDDTSYKLLCFDEESHVPTTVRSMLSDAENANDVDMETFDVQGTKSDEEFVGDLLGSKRVNSGVDDSGEGTSLSEPTNANNQTNTFDETDGFKPAEEESATIAKKQSPV
jgi:Rad3-related DNA helicase